jgi:hypothetical protein
MHKHPEVAALGGIIEPAFETERPDWFGQSRIFMPPVPRESRPAMLLASICYAARASA